MDPIEQSALGAMGSALLAAFAYWARTNHERRRVTRAVFYHLLELHHVINRVAIAVGLLEEVFLSELRRSFAAKGLAINEGDTAVALKVTLPILSALLSARWST